MSYQERANAAIEKCDRENKTDDRCHVDCDGRFLYCPHHREKAIDANKSVNSVLAANGDPGPSAGGTWGPVGDVQGVINVGRQRIRP